VNVLADYQQFFGENETPKPAGIAVLTDSDDTKSTAEGDYATFRVCRKYNPGGRWSSPARAAVLSMCAFAVMGLVISLRLKAELEECLEKVHALLVRAQVEGFMALERSEGDLSRYPQFRWMIPVFYTLALALIAIVLVWPPMARFRPTIGAVP
jgi:hypothetical protein